MNRRLTIAIASLVVFVFLVVFAISWNEARKEVVYLCGNFVEGVSMSSVVKQLDTGELLRYRMEPRPNGSHIEVDSKINFSIYKCLIDFDSDDKVIGARVE